MSGAPGNAPARRRLLLAMPLAVFAALGILFYARLGAGDAAKIPSALIGQPAPAFSLAPLEGGARLTQADLAKGGVTLVNVFASWCVPCHAEHPALMQLAGDAALKARGLRIVGIAYKDALENTRRFLGAKGNPFAAVAVDDTGRTGIDWGVYGVPETFILRGDGVIAYKFTGPMTPDELARTIRPQIEKALAAEKQAAPIPAPAPPGPG